MQDFEKHKHNFDKFLGKIDPTEKIGILSHSNCVDGMISAVFLMEILKKKFPNMSKPFVSFIPYGIGVLDRHTVILNKEGIKKVFILDANVDMNQFEETQRFFENFDVMFIDHHPLSPELKLNEKIIKTHSDDCTSLVLYNLGREFLKEDYWTELVCIAGISEFSYQNEENLRFIQSNYDFDPKNYQTAEIFQKVLKFNSLVTYYSKDSFKAYNFILNKDYAEIDRVNKEISAEFDRCVDDFEKNAERHFDNKLCFYFFKSKFSIGSRLGTALSVKHKNSTIIIISEIEGTNLFKVSTRNNSEDLVYPMNEMLRSAVKNLENGMGGGHDRASGGSFMAKDIDKFKQNIIEFVKHKLNK